MRFGKIIPVIAFLGLVTTARAQVVQYTFPSGSFAPTTVNANVTATSVNATGSSASIEAGNSVPNTVFFRQGILSTTPAAAVSNAQFFQFTVTPTAGNTLNLTSLTFDAALGGSINSPSGYVLRSSLNSFGSDISTAPITTTQPAFTSFSVDLSTSTFQNVNAPITFRLYQYLSTVGGVGDFYDNLTLNGSVTPVAVPEPGSVALLVGMGTMGAGFLTRRRNQARKAA